jgi:3alpha(or 20beta)-hydroxysteroid dehydrogenase
VNVLGCMLGMRTASQVMAEQGGGSIINFSSIEGLASAPALTSYTSTKFAVRGMTKAVALELGRKNVRVNSVHPGMIDTQMLSDAVGGAEIDHSFAAKKVALGRVGQPVDVANMVVFLGSDLSSYATGAEFVIDGGATATHAFNFAG